ncbi:MAG: hypothetical protein JNL48_00260 [Acidobacteria bacterium]|nr:hypothetical protein [Acidobacteriota bacterium]
MRVHLVHWDADDARVRVAALTALGHDAIYLPGVSGTALMRALRAGTPDCFLIDLDRRPSHGREVGAALAASPATRHRPIVCAGGDADAVARMRALLPDAICTPWPRLGTALSRAQTLASTRPSSVPPPRRETRFATRTLAQKLGIAAREEVAVSGAPAGFADLLGPLPAGTRLTATVRASAQRFVWFVTSRRDLDQALGRLAALVTTQVAWIAWPKGAAGRRAGITGNDVRAAGLAAGFVDFKVCSVDATWSGLAFTRRRR